MKKEVQSVIFNKSKFTLNSASSWIIKNGFKIGRVDITKNYYRFRQYNPSKNKKYRIKTLTSSIKLVLEF